MLGEKTVNLFAVEYSNKGYQVVFDCDADAVITGPDTVITAFSLELLKIGKIRDGLNLFNIFNDPLNLHEEVRLLSVLTKVFDKTLGEL